MVSRFVKTHSVVTIVLVIAAFVAASVCISNVTSASVQQPPAAGQQPAAGAGGAGGQGAPGAPGGAGGRGGGFRRPDPLDFEDHDGWTQIFDGTSLAAWEGNPDVWKLVEGAVVGTSTQEKPSGTTYCYWKGGKPKDFELKWEMRLEGPGMNSGMQYRSLLMAGRSGARGPGAPGGGQQPSGPGRPGGPGGQQAAGRAMRFRADPKWDVGGYQFDFEYVGQFAGQLYENAGNAETAAGSRGIVTYRGQVVQMKEGKNPRILASVGDINELKGYYNINGWNQCHLIARGPVLIHIFNGHVMSISLDEDPTRFKPDGLIALQIEGTGTASFRNIWLKNW